jgi:multiple sugar transport system ATP-binding protein
LAISFTPIAVSWVGFFMATVDFQHIFKVYTNGYTAVRDLSLTIADGEFLVLVGPSGCGKSTALRMLAGLEDISAGKLMIGGQLVNAKTPQQRNIAMVFQNYALYPHMTVQQNLEFPLRMMQLSKSQRQARIQQAAETLGLVPLLERKPKQLSGGQRQRVAMGRAIVRDPAVFLMDEPLSNLDAKMRTQIRTEIAALQRRMGTTTVYVTHDQVEAMTMGDRVAVMRAGELQQIAPPQELYDHPANIFVAGFMGSPAMNLFHTQLHKTTNGTFTIDFGSTALSLDAETTHRYPQIERYLDHSIIAGLRPEAFSVDRSESLSDQTIAVDVQDVEALGHEMIIHAMAPIRQKAIEENEPDPALGETSPKSESTLIARIPSTPGIQTNAQLRLSVDSRQVYLFKANGQSINAA